MHIVDVFEYAASPDEVFAMMTDEDFIALVCEAQYSTSYSATVDITPDGATAVANRELPTGGFPDFLTSLVGRSIHVVQTVRWAGTHANGTRKGKLTVSMGHAPIGVTGTITLEPGGLGTVVTYEADLKATLPFIGGKVERAAEPTLVSGVRKERETGRAWLTGEYHEEE